MGLTGAIKKWLAWLGALFTALAALWFARRAGKHRKKQVARAEKVAQLEADKGAHVAEAKIARDQQKAARHDAHAALAKGRAKIQKIREKAHAPALADRVERIARSLRGDA